MAFFPSGFTIVTSCNDERNLCAINTVRPVCKMNCTHSAHILNKLCTKTSSVVYVVLLCSD